MYTKGNLTQDFGSIRFNLFTNSSLGKTTPITPTKKAEEEMN
jgi:hypothetical protein